MLEINLLKYLTANRFLNGVKVISSFGISRVIRKPVVWGMPVSYSIEPTNHCNLKCPECPSGLGELTRPLGLLKFENFKLWIDQINKSGFYIQLFFQGEPYINKNLGQMIDYAQSKNMYVSISTNGHFINNENASVILKNAPDKIIYSMDGLDEISYQNYRVGGTFEQADNGLRSLIKKKKELGLKKPFVEFQFIVMKQNEHLLDDVIKYGNDTGVDRVVFKTMQISSLENAKKFLPDNPKFRRYNVSETDFKIKGKLKNHCFALWRTSVITWDGRVVSCCFDKDANYTFGILNGKSFSEIWKEKTAEDFRQKVLLERQNISMCTNCTEGQKINILEIEQ